MQTVWDDVDEGDKIIVTTKDGKQHCGLFQGFIRSNCGCVRYYVELKQGGFLDMQTMIKTTYVKEICIRHKAAQKKAGG